MFDDTGTDLDGARVVARGITTGRFFELETAGNDATIDAVAESIVEWDLVDEDGAPIPCDREGVLSLEPPESAALIKAWFDAVQGVSAPTVPRSGDGRTAAETSLPMQPIALSG